MRMGKRMVAIVLAAILTFTSSGITVLAEGLQAVTGVEVSVEETVEDNATEETITEDVSEAAIEETVEEVSIEETTTEEVTTEEVSTEEATTESETTESESTEEVTTEVASTEETTTEEVTTEETTTEEETTEENSTEEVTTEETTTEEGTTEENTTEEATTEEATTEEVTIELGEAEVTANDSNKLQAPTISIGGVAVKSGQTIQDTDSIKLSSTLGTTSNSNIKIYYTTDGKKPTENSTLYKGPFMLATSGSKTIKAVAVYNGTKSSITSKKVKVNSYVTKFGITSKTGFNIVSSGKNITLVAGDFVPTYASKKSVKWEITSGAEYAKISSKGVLTANKGITKATTIKVKATATDRGTVTATAQITIIPAVTGLTLKNPDDKKVSLQYPGTKKMEVVVAPAGVNAPIIYTSSNQKVATVSEKGVITAVGTGKATITAKTADGSNKSVKMSVTVVKLVQSVKVTSKTGENVIAVGKSLQMVADVTKDATNKAVEWSVTDTIGVSISSKGVLKATKDVTKITTVTVTATAKDGSGKKNSLKITIYPVATSNVKVEGATTQNVGTKAKGTLTTTVQLLPYTVNYTSNHFGRKEGSGKTNLGNFTYKSSNEKVATVNATGVVTAVSKGTAKITITARDGSKKKTTVTIKVVNPVTSISISSKNGLNFVGRTKSLSLKATVNSDASIKKVKWTSSIESVATVNSSGTVTGKSYGNSTAKAVITATATDGSGVSASFTVTVRPLIKMLAYKTYFYGWRSSNVYTTMDVGTSASIDDFMPAYFDELHTYPDYPQQPTLGLLDYSVSNSSILQVTEKNGTVTVKGVKKGTANITFKALDGSGKKATLQVRVQ